ncbi:histidine ammonia-lyase [Phycisphaerales bacterium]|nr:histidine ammonia-lyase [Phycisphaerales bacterium]
MAEPGQVPLMLDGGPLRIGDVAWVARANGVVTLAAAARAAMMRSRAVVESQLVDGGAHYGINTGFGSLSRQRVAPGDLRDLQRNLVRSHSAGVGPPLPRDVVRGMMLLSAASLARGLSGVRPELVEFQIALLNAGITPIVPEVGSVGASGDLAPLAAMGLAMIGEGEVFLPNGERAPAGRALASANLKPLTLAAKEGLAIINGTHLMAAQGSLLVHDAEGLFDAAVVSAGMAIDACKGTDEFLDDRIHAARNQSGQRLVAARLRGHLAGSEIIPSHRENDPRVQDPYSLRCTPQVLGAAWDCLGYVKDAISRELGAVTDNPLVLDSDIVSAGNFHGMPLAIPLDALTIGIAPIAGIAERRVFWMLSSFDSESGLRPYLSPKPGLHSGLMIAQYTAAACCNEIIGLAHPASVANIPTSAEVEDYNSFGPRAAAKARRALDLAEAVIAIELMCAAEGLECHRPLKSGAGVERAFSLVRSVTPPLSADRPLTPDIEAIRNLIRARAFTGW